MGGEQGKNLKNTAGQIAVSRNRILAVALDYLEKRGMILETKNGFVWTFNPGRKLARAEKEGLEV